MEDWATVAIAVGPALVTGLVGYSAARFQRATARDETKSATLRLRLDHLEGERKLKGTVYRDCLVHLDKHDAMMIGFAPRNTELYEEWVDRYFELKRGLNLLGSPAVNTAFASIAGILMNVGDTALAQAQASGNSFQDGMATAYLPKRADFQAVVRDLVSAMRDDLAPDTTLKLVESTHDTEEKTT